MVENNKKIKDNKFAIKICDFCNNLLQIYLKNSLEREASNLKSNFYINFY